MFDLYVELKELLEKAKQGCPEATRRLHDEYSEPIRQVIRKRMHARLRTVFDSTDFMQSVWADFFTGRQDEVDFDNPDSLIAYLCRMASNKVISKIRSEMGAQRRDSRREQSIEDVPPQTDNGRSDSSFTASEVFIREEEWEVLLAKQPPLHRKILEMLREGHSKVEIADRLSINVKFIQRLLARIAPDPISTE